MERSEMNGDQKMEEIMLPGFRFHPTDEELVGFYLKRKVQERPVSIELIKPLDIYKHDPWDLPKLVATTGEKEWYFYCRRDRKYQNSARPNRVTGGGFWKATGTDRPIYSSDGSKCIGLKKSLVFYKGRAAKGFKTDWMMHEFRLPSTAHHKGPARRVLEKSIPLHELWAICRIFKKPSSSAQRGFSHSWVSPILPKQPSPVLPQCGNNFDHFDHKLFNIDTKSPTLTTNNSKPPPTFISSNQDSAHLISAFEPDYNVTIDTSSLVFNMSPSVISDFDEGLDYMTNEEHQYFNESCFSLDCVPVIMQDEDQEHTTKVMFTSPADIVPFDNQWDFSDSNIVI